MKRTALFLTLCLAAATVLPAQTSIKATGSIETAEQLISTKATGAPLAVSSTVRVTNLNADLLDGNHSDDFAGAAETATELVELRGLIDASLCRPGSSRVGSWCIDNQEQGPASAGESMLACHGELKTLCPLEAISMCDLLPMIGSSCGAATDAGGFLIRTSTKHQGTGSAFDLAGYDYMSNSIVSLASTDQEKFYCCKPVRMPTHLRFVDMSDGTVLDNNTGLRWLKNANCDGVKQWFDAQDWAAQLADGQCGLTDGSVAGEWRLPAVAELCSRGAVGGQCPSGNAVDSLLNTAYSSPALSNAAGSGQCVLGTGDCAFSGVVSSLYWASELSGIFSWFVNMTNGYIDVDSKASTYYVWPVRGGQ